MECTFVGGERLGRVDSGAAIRMVLGAVVRAAMTAMRAVGEWPGLALSDEKEGAFGMVDDDNWVILVRTGATGGMLVDCRAIERTESRTSCLRWNCVRFVYTSNSLPHCEFARVEDKIMG